MSNRTLVIGCLLASTSLSLSGCGSSDDGSSGASAGAGGTSSAGASAAGGKGGTGGASGKGGAAGKGGGGAAGKAGASGVGGAAGKAGGGGSGVGGASGKGGAGGGTTGKGGTGAQAGTTGAGGSGTAGTGAGGDPTGAGGAGGDPTGAGGDPTGAGGDPTGAGGAGGDPTGGGGTGAGATGGSGACPPPPAGITAEAAAAYAAENDARAAIGSPCATMVPALNDSAQAHCAYFTGNKGACVANPHVEVSGCTGFVAAQFWDREKAAGYSGSAVFEDMAFFGNGASAVQIWIDSVWHRTPILSPWVMDFGYGGVPGCDTTDFGNGASSPANLVVSYPSAGQTGVPTSFGGNEGPTPPAPPGGFPSGYPITVFLKGGSITSHELFVDGTSTPIPHVFIAPGDAAAMGLLQNDYVLYANKPLTAQTTYRVKIVGTNGAGPVMLDWTFTTQ